MKRPNFIIFFTDDQGYADLSCMGETDFRTPNLDRLASSGVRFTEWYSNAPVCSPSRAALLTGRYPGNAGIRAILAGNRTTPGLQPEVPTLAVALKKLGYRTGLIGKWHLGLAEGCRPQDHGFDHSFGFYAGCIDYFSHIFYWEMPHVNPLHDLWENGQEIHENGRYFTNLITERAVQFIRDAAASNEPFFLYVPYNAPHYPMHAPKEYMDRFPHLAWDRRIMASMLSAVDDSVGLIMAELERQGLDSNTCVFFSSDNGPSRENRNWLDGREDPYYGGSAGKLKGHKFSLFEGGIRMPAIMAWPGHIPGGRVVPGAGAHMDIFPTFLRAAGGDATQYELDGVDVMPWVRGEAKPPERDLYWELVRQTAIRRGQWKLVLHGQLVETEPAQAPVQLSDLSTDMGETINLKDKHPDVVAEMTETVQTWRNGIETRWQDQWLPLMKPGSTA